MTAKNVVLVLAWATATFVMTLAVFMPGSLDAVSSAVKPEITHPKLTVKGVELTLSLAGGETAVKAGDQPTVEIDVVNPTENVVDLKVDLRMTAVSPMSEDSRSMPMPTEVWKDQRPLELEPFQAIVVNIPTGTKIPAGKYVAITMTCEKRAVELPLVTGERKAKANANAVASAKQSLNKSAKNSAKPSAQQAAKQPATQPAAQIARQAE